MALRPGLNPGESDIVIERTQHRFWRLGAWLDDSGTESTGRYQSGIMLALDNPTSLSDLFYLTASRDLGFAGRKSSKSLSGHYSVPLGYWLFGVTASDYDYHQTVAGYSRDFLYAGKSRSLDVQASRVIYRRCQLSARHALVRCAARLGGVLSGFHLCHRAIKNSDLAGGTHHAVHAG